MGLLDFTNLPKNKKSYVSKFIYAAERYVDYFSKKSESE